MNTWGYGLGVRTSWYKNRPPKSCALIRENCINNKQELNNFLKKTREKDLITAVGSLVLSMGGFDVPSMVGSIILSMVNSGVFPLWWDLNFYQ